MISKELFCKTVADIQTQDTRMNEFGDALNKICDTSVVFDVFQSNTTYTDCDSRTVQTKQCLAVYFVQYLPVS